MSSRDVTFIVLVLFLTLFCDTTSSECTQLAPCICSLPDDYIYNLSHFAHEKPLTASKIIDKDNWTVSFQPCKNVKMDMDKSNNCTNASLCLYNNNTKLARNLGTIEETQMKLSYGKNKFAIFEIHHNNVTSTINILCFPGSETDFTIETLNPSSDPNEYNFILSSPYGCKIKLHKALSTGSVLVIFFFTIVGTYLIGGILVLRTLRGATGWEMLPNYNFWFKLPGLVKDGVIFTFNCCRVDSYERI